MARGLAQSVEKSKGAQELKCVMDDGRHVCSKESIMETAM
jgi:hypothetical protein